ncbi:MAG: alpha/beta fold hydrolase [Candidatus Promineifilaceae bacterium]
MKRTFLQRFFLRYLSFIVLFTLIGCQSQTAPDEAIALIPTLTQTAKALPTPTPIPATSTPTPLPTATVIPTATPTATATPDPLAPVIVTIEAVDRVIATGTFYPGMGEAPWPGVILLHMAGGDRQIWESNGFAQRLVEHGYAVLAVDIRNHGKSGGDDSWEKAAADLRRWWTYFSQREDIDATRTALVGGSIGANLALFTGADKPEVRTVVLLSAGLNYNSAAVDEAVVRYGSRPLFLIASEDDLFPAAEDAQIMASLATGEVELLIYEDAGHGTEMLETKPELAGLIVDWLEQYLQ